MPNELRRHHETEKRTEAKEALDDSKDRLESGCEIPVQS